MADQIKEVRITDQFTIRRISEEQERSGEATATKTAARLINERLAILENERARKPEPLATAG
jgi:hypothetical protein